MNIKALRRIGRVFGISSTAFGALALSNGAALAGGSGLQIEQSLTPWWTFLTSTLPWWAGTVAIVVAAAVLMFGGLSAGGVRILGAFVGFILAAGVIVWVAGSLGIAQGALL